MTDEQTVVKVSGPGELVQAVPYLVGYVPERAVVLLALKGPRQRLGMCAAVPLPPARYLDKVLAPVVAAIARSGAAAVVAVMYPRRAPASTGALPERQVIRAVRKALRATGLRLAEAVLVWEDRWWSYECRDPLCCPPDGRPLPPPERPAPVVAALVAEGVAPSASRVELARRIAPVTGELAARLDAAVLRMLERARAGERPGQRTIELLTRLLGRAAEPAGAPLSDEEAAELLVGLTHVPARDAAVCLVTEAPKAAAVEVMVELVRRAPDSFVAPAATVLAWAAYAHGNGALANIALDRCLEVDPGYTLALLLRDALDAGAHPQALRTAVEEMRADVLSEAG